MLLYVLREIGRAFFLWNWKDEGNLRWAAVIQHKGFRVFTGVLFLLTIVPYNIWMLMINWGQLFGSDVFEITVYAFMANMVPIVVYIIFIFDNKYNLIQTVIRHELNSAAEHAALTQNPAILSRWVHLLRHQRDEKIINNFLHFIGSWTIYKHQSSLDFSPFFLNKDPSIRRTTIAQLQTKGLHLLAPYQNLITADRDTQNRMLLLDSLNALPVTSSRESLEVLLGDTNLHVAEKAYRVAILNKVFSREEWREMLFDEAPHKRMMAARAAAYTRDDKALPYIRPMLEDTETKLVVEAVQALGVLEDEQSALKINDLLQKPLFFSLLRVCAEAVGHLQCTPAIPRLIELLEPQDHLDEAQNLQLRKVAMHSLAHYGLPASNALMRVVKSEEELPTKKRVAAAALAHMREPRLLPFFEQLLQSKDNQIREIAIKATGSFKEKTDKVPRLKPLLNDKTYEVRREAIRQLIKEPDIRVVHELSKLRSWLKEIQTKEKLRQGAEELLLRRDADSINWNIYEELYELDILINKLQKLNRRFYAVRIYTLCTKCYLRPEVTHIGTRAFTTCRKCGDDRHLEYPYEVIEGHIGGGVETGPSDKVKSHYNVQLWQDRKALNADVGRIILHPIDQPDWALSAVLASIENDTTRPANMLPPFVYLNGDIQLQPNTLLLLKDAGWKLQGAQT